MQMEPSRANYLALVYLQFLANVAAAKTVCGGVCRSGMCLSVQHEDWTQCCNWELNGLTTCLLPELCSGPWSALKVFCQCLHTQDCRRTISEPTALCNRETFALVSVDAALRLCDDSLLGPRRLRCSSNRLYSRQSFKHICCIRLRAWSEPSASDRWLECICLLESDTNKPVLNHVVPTCPGDTDGIYSNESTVLVCFPDLFCCLYAVHSWCNIQSLSFLPLNHSVL